MGRGYVSVFNTAGSVPDPKQVLHKLVVIISIITIMLLLSMSFRFSKLFKEQFSSSSIDSPVPAGYVA